MATFKKFEDIGARQKARVLAGEIYSYASKGEFSKDFIFITRLMKSVK